MTSNALQNISQIEASPCEATTIRLAKMNLAVHGLEGDIIEANTFYEDPHRLQDGRSLWGNCDPVMANPPFNVDMADAGLVKDDRRLPFGLPGINKDKRVFNGNYLWISFFHGYLNPTGRAGFVDTNIRIYAHLQKTGDKKGARTNQFVETSNDLVISTHVLGGYYAVMLRNGADDVLIQNNLEAVSRYCEVNPVALARIRSAHRIRVRYRFYYWDSLIVASALESGCTVLYSEDMQAGQQIEGCLRIDNPSA